MKILVTGGCGFIGSNLVDILVEDENNEVVVIDNLVTGKKENINDKATYIFEDIREILKRVQVQSLHRANREFNDNETLLEGVEVIYHLAALARIQPSFDTPHETLDINTNGTVLVCEYARNVGAKVVYAGSSSYYGGVYLNPYSFSKWQGEEICQMYSKVYGLNTSIARFFNVYGPRHLCEGVYATVVGIFEKQYKFFEALSVTGNGEQRRDFTHVSDICNGLIAISKNDYDGKIFNLGTGRNYSINQLAKMFRGSDIDYIPQRPGEAWETLADISNTTKETDWKPRYNLEEYVKDFIRNN